MSPEIEAIIKLDDQIDNLKRMRQRLLLALLDSDIAMVHTKVDKRKGIPKQPREPREPKEKQITSRRNKHQALEDCEKLKTFLSQNPGWVNPREIHDQLFPDLTGPQQSRITGMLVKSGDISKRGERNMTEYALAGR